MPDVIVVGAGLSGLIAAQQLQDHGAEVLVVDKGRGPGGRLATRRLGPDEALLDHGAQFFTVRSDALQRMIAAWPVHVWHHGPAMAGSIIDDPSTATAGGDGHPRYVGDRGMNGIAKYLATDLDVRASVRVESVTPTPGGGWTVATEAGQVWSATRVLLTPPVPQTLQLLVGTPVPDDVASLAYDPCLGLLSLLDGPSGITAVQFAEGPVNYLADNASKGISPVPAVTVHARGPWSRDHYDDTDDTVAEMLVTLAAPWVHPSTITTWQVKRWRYAQPCAPHPEAAVQVADGLVLAGDTFGSAKVEGAVLSGLAAAELLRA